MWWPSSQFFAYMSESFTVVNRTNSPLYATWDGKPLEIPAGESLFTIAQAQAIKRQNAVHGSGSPGTNELIFKVGIRELGDPCFPIDTSSARSAQSSTERWLQLYPAQSVVNKENR